MSKELNNITDAVMGDIREGKLKMRPRVYFVVGSVLTFVGLVSSILISVFLVGLLDFSLRAHGPMGDYRLDQILSSFPWWAIVVTVMGLVMGIWILLKYDFSYKVNVNFVAIGFILAVLVAGLLIDQLGINDILLRQGPGPMRELYEQYDGDTMRGPGWQMKQSNIQMMQETDSQM